MVDVNWHSTMLRTWTNNLVAVPNSKISETVITNYSKPEDPLDVVIYCGVSYESDLTRVKAVSLDVMERLRQEHPDAHQESEPIFRYEEFGDSNINFYMVMRANNRLAGFEVRSELINQLHSRLAAEGITIKLPGAQTTAPRRLDTSGGDSARPRTLVQSTDQGRIAVVAAWVWVDKTQDLDNTPPGSAALPRQLRHPSATLPDPKLCCQLRAMGTGYRRKPGLDGGPLRCNAVFRRWKVSRKRVLIPNDPED